MKEGRNPATEEYEKIWRGEQASMNTLRASNPNLVETVAVLHQWGVVDYHKDRKTHDTFVSLKPDPYENLEI